MKYLVTFLADSIAIKSATVSVKNEADARSQAYQLPIMNGETYVTSIRVTRICKKGGK